MKSKGTNRSLATMLGKQLPSVVQNSSVRKALSMRGNSSIRVSRI